MADATCTILRESCIPAEDVQYVVPHQAGTGIVQLASMKLDEIGVRGEVVNRLTTEVGNVSSSSIPFALRKAWWTLDGTIACPSAGVGSPGQARITQGCIVLQATQLHATAKYARLSSDSITEMALSDGVCRKVGQGVQRLADRRETDLWHHNRTVEALPSIVGGEQCISEGMEGDLPSGISPVEADD
jgi:hypothetical protein